MTTLSRRARRGASARRAPRRRSGPVSAAVGAAAIVVTSTVVSWAPAAAVAAQTDPVALPPPPPPEIELVEATPWSGPDDTVTIDVELSGDLTDTTIRVLVHEAVDDAEELEESLDQNVGEILHVGDPVPTAELLSPGGSTRRITVAGDDLGPAGVHPVVVELRTATAEVVDRVRTPVIGLGEGPDALVAPELSLLVDVGVRPTLLPVGRRELSAPALERFARLADLLDRIGRGSGTGATLIAVPDTLEALTASTEPEAADLLESMLDRGDDWSVLASPYVPVSARAMTGAGLDAAIDQELDAGMAVLTDRFGATPIDSATWPDDDVDAESAAVLAERGIAHALVPTPTTMPSATSDDLPTPLLEPLGPRVLPSAGGGMSGVTVDTVTSESLLGAAPSRPDAATLVLSELIVRDDERGSAVAVRVDDAPQSSRLLTVLPLLLEADAPVALGRLQVPPPDPLLPPIVPAEAEAVDLSPVAFGYLGTANHLDTFEGFLAGDSARPADLRARLLTSLASDLDTDERRELIETVDGEITAGFGALHLTGQTDLNLTSRRGELPVAIQNDNDYAVQVTIRLRSDRLAFPEGTELTVEAAPGVTRVAVAVEARATGSIPTSVELRTPDGAQRLDGQQLNVRSTAISGVGLAISLGALAVLAFWWVRNIRRTRSQSA